MRPSNRTWRLLKRTGAIDRKLYMKVDTAAIIEYAPKPFIFPKMARVPIKVNIQEIYARFLQSGCSTTRSDPNVSHGTIGSSLLRETKSIATTTSHYMPTSVKTHITATNHYWCALTIEASHSPPLPQYLDATCEPF